MRGREGERLQKIKELLSYARDHKITSGTMNYRDRLFISAQLLFPENQDSTVKSFVERVVMILQHEAKTGQTYVFVELGTPSELPMEPDDLDKPKKEAKEK